MYRARQVKSPIKACREFCLECMNEDRESIRNCMSGDCPIFEYRMGKTERGNYPDVPVLSAIRNQCIECVGTYKEVEDCSCAGKNQCNGIEDYKCPLYEFRFGVNPFIKEKKPTEKQVEARLKFVESSRSRTQFLEQG